MDNKSLGTKVIHGTVIIVVVGIAAKFASFVSEAVLAAYLGTTYQSDAYYMVWSVHTVVYPMMSVGIWNVFLPLYKERISKGEISKADGLTNKSLTFFTTISFAVVVLLILFAPTVVSVVAPGFKGVTRDICIQLVRISAPMYIFIIASAVYASILQCHDKFLGSQIREVVSHLPIIIAAIIFYHYYGISSLAVALVVSGILRLVIELPFVDWGYKYKVDYKFRSSDFLIMLRRLPSALVSAGVVQLNSLIDKAMASTLPEGTVSGLNYGHKLMNVFSGLLSSAIATALYPQMIELIVLKKENELSRLLVKIINIFCVLMVPVTIACILFRTELVSAVFQRGSFNEASSVLTSSIFALYCIGIFFVACSTVINNLFYGYGNTKTPMYISLINLFVNVTLNIFLIRRWGANGLALATSLSAVVAFVLRILATRRYIKLDMFQIMRTSGKVILSSLIACFVPRIIFWILPANKYLVLVASLVLGCLLYVSITKLIKVKELNDVILFMGKRLKKRV